MVVPRRGAGGKQLHRWPRCRAQIVGQRQIGDRAVLDLHPFMAEDHVGLAVPVHIQRAVQAFPIPRGHGAVAPFLKRPQGMIGTQNLCPPADAIRFEGGKQVVTAPVEMHFRRPEIFVRPKAGPGAKDREGTVEMRQIVAGVGIKAVALAPAIVARRAIEIVFSVQQDDVGVANLDFAAQHGSDSSLSAMIIRFRFNVFSIA